MITGKYNRKLLLLFLITTPLLQAAKAQEKKVAPTPQELYSEIAHADSVLFGYFNTQNFEPFKAMFTKDLEWFQDNGGLEDYNLVFKNFKEMFARPYKLTRQLVSGSLEVHPIKKLWGDRDRRTPVQPYGERQRRDRHL